MTKKALAITSYNHNTIFSPLIFKFGKNSAAVILNVGGIKITDIILDFPF